jgi:hypothetical protein
MDENHKSEAACLLEQGASYRRRVGVKRAADGPIFAGFKHGAFSLYFGDAPIFHFDLEGRWQRAFLGGRHYLKGLDGSVQALDRVREGENLVLKRQTLDATQASDFDQQVHAMAMQLKSELDGGLSVIEPPAHKAQPLSVDELGRFLEQISAWDSAAWFAHGQRYCATYGPLPFLPPECQNAVLLQATVGRRGGFDFGLARAPEPQARSLSEFLEHTSAVAALWGKRLLQGRILFLSGSELFHRPAEDVKASLDAIAQNFTISPVRSRAAARSDIDENTVRFDGIHAFLDDFRAVLAGPADWREFAARGVSRLSLGLESGDPAIRALYEKSYSDDELRATLAAIKSAGLPVSMLTLVGAGGAAGAEPHVEHTTALIASLNLSPGDFVFLLDENEIRDPGSSPTAMSVLSGTAWLGQQAKLKESLAPLKQRGIKVLPYTFEKQWA